MKSILPFLFLLVSVSLFGQTKEDVLTCLNLIFQQDEFQPAFSNDLVSNGAIVITSDMKVKLRGNEFHKIRASLTQDDFRDFAYPVKLITSGELEELDVNLRSNLEFGISGSADKFNIVLSTFVKNENLTYVWTYRLLYADDEWIILSRDLTKNR